MMADPSVKLVTKIHAVANDLATGALQGRLAAALERVRPESVRIATAYLTPDGFLALKNWLAEARDVRLLLGERPFLMRRGPEERLRQPVDNEETAGPLEAIDWYRFLEGDYPWILLTHDERKALLNSGEGTALERTPFSTGMWAKVQELVRFLSRDGVEMRRYLAGRRVPEGRVPEGRVPEHGTHSKVRLHDIRALQDAGQPMELNGHPLRFPRHEIPHAVSYSLESLYGGIYRGIISAIESLTFAVYDLESYGVQMAANADSEGRIKQRNRSFIGIMRTIFLKRMESSIVALMAAVRADRDRLALLLTELESTRERWEQGDDPKLQALRQLLDGLPSHDAHGVPSKVVVFTNYKDTADYIFRSLGGRADYRGSRERRVQSNLADGRWMALLTGGDDQRRRAEVLSYFAPLAFIREDEPPDDPILLDKVAPFREEGIDLLIATDVLSEGQNLQDAQYLVNYDLPWNPVRMIQRAGRIDRLFSPHERVFFYNVMPERELEDLLKLVGRLSARVASIEELVGLDASVLGEQIEEKALDKIMKLAAGGDKADEVYREGEQTQGLDDAFAELNRFVEMVKEIGTEDVKAVPDGVYSIRLGKRPGVFIMLRMPEELSGQVFWRFYPMDEGYPLTSPSDVVSIIEATREDQRQDLPAAENPFRYLQEPLQAAIDQLSQEYKQQVGEKTQDDFTKRLGVFLARDDVMEADPNIWDRLHRWRQDPPPADTLSRTKVAEQARVVRQTRAGAPLDELLPRLQSLWSGLEAEGLDRPIRRPVGREPTVRDLELVCWELVVAPPMVPPHR